MSKKERERFLIKLINRHVKYFLFLLYFILDLDRVSIYQILISISIQFLIIRSYFQLTAVVFGARREREIKDCCKKCIGCVELIDDFVL
jgi:hypothetical protein